MSPLAEVFDVLVRTPGVLDALLRGLHPAQVEATEGPGTWSPYQVAGHLLYAEQANWLPRVRHILSGSPDPLPAFDRYAHLAQDVGEPIEARLDQFIRLRNESLDELGSLNLTERDLARPGRHPELGDVNLAQLLTTWAVHDLDHVTQVIRTLAKRYGTAVGPWSVHLSVLRDRT